jgi:hypothetical protein
MPGQHQAQLVERDIRLLFDGCVDQARMILDRGRTPVAALRLGGRGAMLQHQLPPADRARRADPEPLGRSPARHPALDRGHHPLTKILRKHSRHRCRPPPPGTEPESENRARVNPYRFKTPGNRSKENTVG